MCLHLSLSGCVNLTVSSLWANHRRTLSPHTSHYEEHLFPPLCDGYCQPLLQELWVHSDGTNVVHFVQRDLSLRYLSTTVQYIIFPEANLLITVCR